MDTESDIACLAGAVSRLADVIEVAAELLLAPQLSSSRRPMGPCPRGGAPATTDAPPGAVATERMSAKDWERFFADHDEAQREALAR